MTHASDKREHIVADTYLKRENGQYIILVLGKNGDPQVGKPIDVRLTHQKVGVKETSLITDANGTIHLGQLPKISSIHVESCSIAAEWQITGEQAGA